MISKEGRSRQKEAEVESQGKKEWGGQKKVSGAGSRARRCQDQKRKREKDGKTLLTLALGEWKEAAEVTEMNRSKGRV